MRQIKAAIFDVDGTLFDYRSGSIPNSVVTAIQKLKDKGIVIVVATARAYPELSEDLLDRISADYYVAASGHSIQDKCGRTLFAFRFTYDQVETVKNCAKKYGAGLTLRYEDCNCLYSHPVEMYQIYSNIGKPRCSSLYCEGMDYHKKSLPIGFAIKSESAIRAKICEELAAYPNDYRLELFGNGVVVDVFSPHANKMTALVQLMQRLGFAKDDCIAFGDGKNDIEMLKWAGIGVAMGNANEDLKKYADDICGPSWDDGIANYLYGIQLID